METVVYSDNIEEGLDQLRMIVTCCHLSNDYLY